MKSAIFGLTVACALASPCVASPRFPFQISYGGETNATSVAHLLDAPAGKHGFVRVEGGNFVTDAGPIRFNGTNITGPANFPAAPGRVRCWALGPDGMRMAMMKSAPSADGAATTLDLSPDCRTLWYEVSIDDAE